MQQEILLLCLSHKDDEYDQEKDQNGKYFDYKPPIWWYLVEMLQKSTASAFDIA